MGNKSRALELISLDDLARIEQFAKDKETPCLIIDLKTIAEHYDELALAMPGAKIYYAMKANPLDEVISLLAEKGAYFDVASRFEIDQILRLGIPGERMSYGNTIKKEKDIAYAYEKGIRLYSTDSLSDIQKISRNAPGSMLIF